MRPAAGAGPRSGAGSRCSAPPRARRERSGSMRSPAVLAGSVGPVASARRASAIRRLLLEEDQGGLVSSSSCTRWPRSPGWLSTCASSESRCPPSADHRGARALELAARSSRSASISARCRAHASTSVPSLDGIGCRAHGRRRRGHGQHRPTSRRSSWRGTASASSRSTWCSAATARCPRRTSPTTTPSSRSCARPSSLPTTSQPSVGDFISVVRAAARRRRRGRVRSTSPAGSPARPSRRGRRPRRSSARARAASACTCGLHHGRRRARAARAGGAPPARPRARPRTEILGRARRGAHESSSSGSRSTRSSSSERGGRIGAASAWIGSTLRVKPILTRRERDDPGRARAHQLARVRADGRLRAPAPRVGRRRLVRAAHQRARAARAADRARAARSSRASPPWSARSGRCSPRTRGPGLLGTGAIPLRFLP